MTFSLAQFILKTTDNKKYQHLQHEVKGLSVEDGLQICKDLEELTDRNDSFTLQLWTDGSFAVYRMNYWTPGEHILGHTDQLVLSVDA